MVFANNPILLQALAQKITQAYDRDSFYHVSTWHQQQEKLWMNDTLIAWIWEPNFFIQLLFWEDNFTNIGPFVIKSVYSIVFSPSHFEHS
jgi:hypothetical protein